MKIGILTYHDTANYGSFLQCYSLWKIMEERYPNICFEIINYTHAEVEDSFKYVELNYNSNSLREIFFEMLEDSEDADHREDYKTKWVMYGARQGAKYDPFVGGGIPEVDLEADFMREMFDYIPQEPYRRTNRKIGANEPCPCGSGKKFKKCCRGNGKYD